jgi:1-deoxy-D-xylulose-5-phosphate reductoisomerase
VAYPVASPFIRIVDVRGKRIAILGSTGSIGRQTLEVIEGQPAFDVCALAAGGDWEQLASQARATDPEVVALADPSGADALAGALPSRTSLLTGPDAASDLIRQTRPDMVVSGVVGAAGLKPTLTAIDCGCALALANKETLVLAGEIVIPAARAANVPLLPVDSEHSAIFQCLTAGKRSEVKRVILSASGGALRDWSDDDADNATVDDALKHPNWSMGRKITIDSATMMNKALEMIEAHWLFDLAAEQIEVVLHSQSVLHSAVEFCDGSVIAQMGPPDMTGPIAYALGYPDRLSRPAKPLDFSALGQLTFSGLTARFQRAIDLGYEVIRRGNTAGAIVNAANEAAVEAFLDGQIRFGRIVDLVEAALEAATPAEKVTIETLLAADTWAREFVKARLRN